MRVINICTKLYCSWCIYSVTQPVVIGQLIHKIWQSKCSHCCRHSIYDFSELKLIDRLVRSWADRARFVSRMSLTSSNSLVSNSCSKCKLHVCYTAKMHSCTRPWSSDVSSIKMAQWPGQQITQYNTCNVLGNRFNRWRRASNWQIKTAVD